MDVVQQHDLGALVTARKASAFVSATAGGTGDNTAVNGTSIQRSLIGLPTSAVLAVIWSATLTATKTLSLSGVKIQHSDDGSNWTDFETFDNPGVVATGGSGGSTENGQTVLSADLSGAKDYVRAVFTPDLSASGTDTASLLAALIFSGHDRLPATA